MLGSASLSRSLDYNSSVVAIIHGLTDQGERDRENFTVEILTWSLEENGDDHSVHTEHTSHDDGNDRSEEELGLEHGHRDDTNTGLCSSVGGSQVGEDEGRGDAHGAEEDGLVGVAKVCTTNESSRLENRLAVEKSYETLEASSGLGDLL